MNIVERKDEVNEISVLKIGVHEFQNGVGIILKLNRYLKNPIST